MKRLGNIRYTHVLPTLAHECLPCPSINLGSLRGSPCQSRYMYTLWQLPPPPILRKKILGLQYLLCFWRTSPKLPEWRISHRCILQVTAYHAAVVDSYLATRLVVGQLSDWPRYDVSSAKRRRGRSTGLQHFGHIRARNRSANNVNWRCRQGLVAIKISHHHPQERVN